MMRRALVILLAPLLFGAPALAQSQSGVEQAAPNAVLQIVTQQLQKPSGRGTVAQVVGRVMSFDRNADGMIQPGELAERMRPVVARGDANADGVLDVSELRALASAPPARNPVRGGFQNFGSYGFADEFDTSSSSLIEGALDDLRLASSKKEPALATVRAYVREVEAAASADLMRELDGVLTSAQLQDLRWTLTTRAAQNSGAGAPVQAQKLAAAMRTNVTSLIRRYKVDDSQRPLLERAVTRYTERVRLDDASRMALVDRVKDILTPQERDDFRAALGRRPVVSTGVRNVVFSAPRRIDAPAPPARPGGMIPIPPATASGQFVIVR